MKFNPSRLKIGGLVAVVIMALTAMVLPLSLTWVNDARLDHQQVEERLATLRRVHELLLEAETGQRGYVITGKDTFLQPYHAALAVIPVELHTLSRRYASDAEHEQQLVAELLRNAEQRLASLAQGVQLRQGGGFAAAEPFVTSAQGKGHMDEVRRIVADLEALESQELSDRDDEMESKIWRATGIALASTVLTLGLLGYLAMSMVRAVRAGEQAAAEASRTSEQLQSGVAVLQRRNDEISMLGEMSRVLHTEMTLVEALEVTSLFCGRLLPGTSGGIYLFRNSADLLELAATWGPLPRGEKTMEPAACWGLRRGQLHRHGSATDLRCRHSRGNDVAARGYEVCLPLIAYGEVLGLLNLQGPVVPAAGEVSVDEAAAMAQTISEQIALALSNAKLRQVLRDQSIKDPLTGLYNRRYMEETLARELVRAQRNGTPLSVVVADLDHFKRINDVHGHPAGDAVLRSAARQVASLIRASDVACRYGGEEFVLILGDCSKEAAIEKAQQICDALRALAVKGEARAIPVTASFGVACAPEDGDEPGVLIEAADRAVYRAKRAGRDRVVAAGEFAMQAAPSSAVEG
ncbi:diguanylate cyclase [Caldimonas tepidiphila]|uniref:diguanylate cyclase n=1 Tax=Caldimonas tepidiphila TaxID=2315841 RepID=UPI00196B3E2B|nr:diguanylate cyclase [Caldimonas tepidiphila]